MKKKKNVSNMKIRIISMVPSQNVLHGARSRVAVQDL